MDSLDGNFGVNECERACAFALLAASTGAWLVGLELRTFLLGSSITGADTEIETVGIVELLGGDIGSGLDGSPSTGLSKGKAWRAVPVGEGKEEGLEGDIMLALLPLLFLYSAILSWKEVLMGE